MFVQPYAAQFLTANFFMEIVFSTQLLNSCFMKGILAHLLPTGWHTVHPNIKELVKAADPLTRQRYALWRAAFCSILTSNMRISQNSAYLRITRATLCKINKKLPHGA